jgi:hypothetical protein
MRVLVNAQNVKRSGRLYLSIVTTRVLPKLTQKMHSALHYYFWIESLSSVRVRVLLCVVMPAHIASVGTIEISRLQHQPST